MHFWSIHICIWRIVLSNESFSSKYCSLIIEIILQQLNQIIKWLELITLESYQTQDCDTAMNLEYLEKNDIWKIGKIFIPMDIKFNR